MRVVSVVGARPQFVKLAPIHRELRSRGVEHVIVHTGQHYDALLSEVFFEDLGIPSPDVHIPPRPGTAGEQIGRMLTKLDRILPSTEADWVLVYGDTNSTLAGALSAAKLGIPLAHLEAGLRSHNRQMPEELNRVLTDHAADLLLAPTTGAASQLESEGVSGSVVVTGDVMVDVLQETLRKKQPSNPLLTDLGLRPGGYHLATIHRAGNTDDPQVLRRILDSLSQLDLPVVLLAHPRLAQRCEAAGLEMMRGNLIPHPPLPYPELLAALAQSRGLVTDSGGLQKEAFLLRVPCTTVRGETEWKETLEGSWNVLAAPGPQLLQAADRPQPEPTDAAPYGDGHAARAVVDALVTHRVSE